MFGGGGLAVEPNSNAPTSGVESLRFPYASQGTPVKFDGSLSIIDAPVDGWPKVFEPGVSKSITPVPVEAFSP